MAEELRYIGHLCRRCGCALLETEAIHCGGKNPDGDNCSAAQAREYLAATGGIRTWDEYAQARKARDGYAGR